MWNRKQDKQPRGLLVGKCGTETGWPPFFSPECLRLTWPPDICGIYLCGGGKWGTVFQQHGGDILVPFAGGQVKGRVTWSGGRVGRGPTMQQLLDDVNLSQPTGDVQRCLVVLYTERWGDRQRYSMDWMNHNEALCTNLGLGVHLGSVLQQITNYICLASPRRHVERRFPSLEVTNTTCFKSKLDKTTISII